ncbi:MAG: methionine--tRNA ligase [Clostridiales bacterium]|jgi:methionyl-tRNA synthetase|nr:methionine--tRNA ligase [Clostridiales bacterium]
MKQKSIAGSFLKRAREKPFCKKVSLATLKTKTTKKKESMKTKKRILTAGAWPYANNYMHVGHLAAMLPGDIVSRYHRLIGNEVIFVSGSDCHGTPITERAKRENVPPFEIADKYHKSFKDCFARLNFSYDYYGATYEGFHKEEVRRVFLKLYEDGWFYEQKNTQDYCPTCKTFLSDREIRGVCPHCGQISKGDQCDECLASLDASQLKDKTCAACGGATAQRENKSLMFKLSEFQGQLERLLAARQDTWRTNALNETRKYLEQGLPDRAVTRDLSWGIDVPVKGFEDKKIYVWIEAVLGYYTCCKKVAGERGAAVGDFLKDDGNLSTYYIHGKDNIPFHTVIFPALLLAMNPAFQLPEYIMSCEYIKTNNEKMSKSLGNLIAVPDLLDAFDADTVRFYAILSNPEKKDSGFTTAGMIGAHNKILVGGLGNFVNRNASYLKKKFGGVVPDGAVDQGIADATRALYKDAGARLEAGYTREALELLVDYVQAANKYYDDRKPWVQAHTDPAGFGDTTATCLYMIANMSNLFYPFIPSAMERLKGMLGLEAAKWEEARFTAKTLGEIGIHFNRIEN